ncbi:hypothetical protein HMI54_002214 [Coelomomyces lativittatus]|nr:hypothetical protein HMI56_000408 [Coelomomyces lativittatus]KAJ1509657.1 hypothetical protein HMI54_002214 [Coelomomyces lativittatus]KAJ1511104.1 hypothetical protein HMI55_006724 [Coelomomyces lativittatus]
MTTLTTTTTTPFTLHRLPKEKKNHVFPTTYYPPSTPTHESSPCSKFSKLNFMTPVSSKPKKTTTPLCLASSSSSSSMKKEDSSKGVIHLLGHLKVDVHATTSTTDGRPPLDTESQSFFEIEDEPSSTTLTFPLYSGHNLIGYSPDFFCHEDDHALSLLSHKKIFLELPGISKKHASLYILENGLIFLQDFDSTNGTYLPLTLPTPTTLSNPSFSTTTTTTTSNTKTTTPSSPTTLFPLLPNFFFQVLPPYQFQLAQYHCQITLDYLPPPSTTEWMDPFPSSSSSSSSTSFSPSKWIKPDPPTTPSSPSPCPSSSPSKKKHLPPPPSPSLCSLNTSSNLSHHPLSTHLKVYSNEKPNEEDSPRRPLVKRSDCLRFQPGRGPCCRETGTRRTPRKRTSRRTEREVERKGIRKINLKAYQSHVDEDDPHSPPPHPLW